MDISVCSSALLPRDYVAMAFSTAEAALQKTLVDVKKSVHPVEPSDINHQSRNGNSMVCSVDNMLDENGLSVIAQKRQLILSSSPHIMSDLLRSLTFLLTPDLISKAVLIADSDKVEVIQAMPSGRRLVRIQGSAIRPYICLHRYCSCPDFSRRASSTPPNFYCKHILAQHFAKLYCKYRILQISDQEMVSMFDE